MSFLYTFVILLAAAIVAVPLAKRFGFGSVLGYLGAGLVIGPAGLIEALRIIGPDGKSHQGFLCQRVFPSGRPAIPL